MLTFEIVEGSLRISNGTSVILLISKQFVYVNTLSLQNAEPKVEIYNINLGTNAVVIAQPLSQCLDSAGNPFTVESFILFAEVNLGFNGGGTPQPITPLPATSVKYYELVSLISDSKLVPNTNYLISDYATIYDQPDYDADGFPKESVATLQGETEPLIVYAISVSQISNVAVSTVYPNDTIFYDWNFQFTEFMSQPARGRITKRIDNELNINTGYDFRAVVYKRYQDEFTGLYTVINDNEQGYRDDIPTFGSHCNNMTISNVRTGSPDEPVFFMPNSIFGTNCFEVSTLDNFYNNTIGDSCSTNTFGYNCHDNVISDDFTNNTILNNFSLNTISTRFNTNNILNNFQSNTIGDGFTGNIIGNDFSGNIINNKTQNNNILNNFKSNTIGDGFTGNIIGNNFGDNNIDSDFASNAIGNDFYNNTIGVNFNRNQIFREFYDNNQKNGTNITGDFQNNLIYAEVANVDFKVRNDVFYLKPNVRVITGFDEEGNPSGQPYYEIFITNTKTMTYGALNNG